MATGIRWFFSSSHAARIAAHDDVADVAGRARVEHAAGEVPGAVGCREVDRGECDQAQDGRRHHDQHALAIERARQQHHVATAVPALTRITPPTPAPMRAEPSTIASTMPAQAIVAAARRLRTAG